MQILRKNPLAAFCSQIRPLIAYVGRFKAPKPLNTKTGSLEHELQSKKRTSRLSKNIYNAAFLLFLLDAGVAANFPPFFNTQWESLFGSAIILLGSCALALLLISMRMAARCRCPYCGMPRAWHDEAFDKSGICADCGHKID